MKELSEVLFSIGDLRPVLRKELVEELQVLVELLETLVVPCFQFAVDGGELPLEELGAEGERFLLIQVAQPVKLLLQAVL